MKKITFVCIILACLSLNTSCSNNNTPTGVANKFIEYYKEKNYEGIKSLIEFYNEDSTMVTNEKIDIFMEGFKEKAKDIEQREGQIKSMEIVEDIDQSVNSGNVKIKITFENGNIDDDKIPLKKNDKGEWKISVDLF